MPIFRRDQDVQSGPAVLSTPKQVVTLPAEPTAQETSRGTVPAVPQRPVVKAEPETRPPAPSHEIPREAAAIIDRHSEITGTLHSQGNVVVEGSFQGEIEAKEAVYVEKGAEIQAQLRANDAIISGSFNGEIVCQRRVQIAATATISGEIKTPVLVIAEGSTVNCRFAMSRLGR